MPDFATNFTGRVVQRYYDGYNNHSHLWRYQAGDDPLDLIDQLVPVYVAMALLCPGTFAMLDASNYLAGNDFSLPISPVSGLIAGGGGLLPGGQAFSISWVARSNAGANYKVRLFGVRRNPNDVPGSDYRFQYGEDSLVDDVTDALGGATLLRGIDNEPLVWKTYANYRVDSYWQSQR